MTIVFFRDCIYELPLRYMISHHFLVPPTRLDMPILQYDFSQVRTSQNGIFNQEDLNREVKKTTAYYTPYCVTDN